MKPILLGIFLFVLHSSVYAESISNNTSLSGLSANTDDSVEYELVVPDGASNLSISISSGTGDADLYVRAGSRPTTSTYDCRPYLTGNTESCDFSSPEEATYYIDVVAYSRFSGVTLSVSFDSSDDTSSTSSETVSGATWDGFSDYYSDAIGETGTALIDALNEAAALGHTRLTYTEVWDALRYTDEDDSNTDNVILFYTGRSQSKTFTSSGDNDPDAWNREHSWPKSHGFPSSGQWAYTDIHHLRPTDASVNSSRGSKDYDNGGDSLSEAPENYTDDDSFEPRDEVKGDVARMMFYMDVRYNDNDSTGTGDLELVDYAGTSGSELGVLCTLLTWHNQDPVSTDEITRHGRIVEVQGNRNPFVDYPDWVNEVFDADCE